MSEGIRCGLGQFAQYIAQIVQNTKYPKNISSNLIDQNLKLLSNLDITYCIMSINWHEW